MHPAVIYGGNVDDPLGTYHLNIQTPAPITDAILAEIWWAGRSVRLSRGGFNGADKQQTIQYELGSANAQNLIDGSPPGTDRSTAPYGFLTVGRTMPVTLVLKKTGDVEIFSGELDVPIVAKPSTAPDVDQTARDAAAAAQATANSKLTQSQVDARIGVQRPVATNSQVDAVASTDTDLDGIQAAARSSLDDSGYLTVRKGVRMLQRVVKRASTTVLGLVLIARNADLDATETDTSRVPTVAGAKRLVDRLRPAARQLPSPTNRAADAGKAPTLNARGSGYELQEVGVPSAVTQIDPDVTLIPDVWLFGNSTWTQRVLIGAPHSLDTRFTGVDKVKVTVATTAKTLAWSPATRAALEIAYSAAEATALWNANKTKTSLPVKLEFHATAGGAANAGNLRATVTLDIPTETLVQALTSAIALAWNVDGGEVGTVTLSHNATLTISGGRDGQMALLRVTQDGAGSRTLSFGGSAVDISSGAGDVDLALFHRIGTTWRLVGVVEDVG